jgi:uroporphyrinogen-III decarboxylase
LTYRERMLRAIRGDNCDVLPCVPRLDLWYKANRVNGTLPNRFKNAALSDIIESLDIGHHMVIPDYRDASFPESEASRSLGLYQCNSICYRIDFDVERSIEIEGSDVVTRYETPKGTITTRVRYDEEMRREGVTLSLVREHAIKDIGDFEAAGNIFEHAAVTPCYENFNRKKEEIGDRGVIAAFCTTSASGMHFILQELMPLDKFFLATYDYPQELSTLSAQIETLLDRIFDIVAQSPARVLLLGVNFDSMITYPPFFEKYIAPSLKEKSERLHRAGKYLLCHTDGENRGLLDLYVRSGIDVADSYCPAPMTKTTLKEARETFGDRVTVWGGVPSVAFLEDSMSEHDFDRYLDMTMDSIGDGKRMIIAIADSTPPAAKFERIEKLIKKTREFGPAGG